MGGTEVISATRGISATTGTFTDDVTVNGGDFNLTKQNGAPYINILWDGNNPTANTLLHNISYKVDYDGTHQNWGAIEHRTTSSAVRTELRFNVKSSSGNVQNALTLQGQASAVPNATFAGDVTIGGTSSESRTLTLQTNSEKDSVINLKEGGATYGFSIGYYGVGNDFIIKRHDNSTNGTDVFTLYRENNNASFAGNITTAGNLMPSADSTHNIGSNSVRWDNIYADNLYGIVDKLSVTANDTFTGTYSLLWHSGNVVYSSSFMTINGATDTLSVPNISTTGDVTVGGDLIVNGTTTTINTATVEVEDNILQLNTTQGSPDTATAATSGISIYRGDGVTQASFIFDDADDTWDLTNNLTVGALTSGQTAQLVINHEGGASAVAKFMSRTNRAFIQVGDNDTNGYLVAEGNVFSIGRTASASANNINIDSSHRVGIGKTTSPSKILHVYQTGNNQPLLVQTDNHVGIQVKGGNSHDRYVSFQQANGTVGAKVGWDHSSQTLKLNAVDSFASTHLAVDVNGNVGVKTDSPKALLHVKNEANNWEDGVLLEHDTGNTGWNIHPENNSNNALWFGYNSDTSVALTSQGATTALKLNSDLSANFASDVTADRFILDGGFKLAQVELWCI